jgi:GAF domain-containing protein
MINATATELRHNLETLENKVKERTANLETIAENARQRADQLQSIIEITHTITSIQNFDELLPEITQQTSAALGFYHVSIFLTDQTGQYAILQASNSAGGQKMLKKGYRLKVGQAGIVGFVTGSGQPRIALDVGDDATFSNNPDLPDTLSEMALPLRVGENIIGALDLQSNEASAFSAEDIGMFSLLANQIAIVIQNARLFEETRAALIEAQVFYRQSATASWREVLRQGTRGYRYLNGSVEAVKTAGETPKKIAAGGGNNSELLTIPINIRGKNLGVLNIRQTGRSQSWSSSEIHIYQSIVDRISFALENARLYQDAQRRASKERVISEIATKVSSSVNMDNILQTAVEELGRVLPGSEVVIQFEQEDETGA